MLNSKDAIVKNTSKRYSFARNAIKIALLFVSLGILAPTPIQAQSVASNYRDFVSFRTGMQTDVEEMKETKYTQEEVDRSLKRLENLTVYFENIYKEDGKTKKSEAELKESDYIIKKIWPLKREEYGKYADKLEVLITKIAGYTLIFVNNDFLDCSEESWSYTNELEKGFSNLTYAMAGLQSDTTRDGKLKTEEQLASDKLTADLLKDYHITGEDITFVYNESKKKSEEKTSLEIPENEKRLEKIGRNLKFLIKIINKKCQVNSFSDEKREVIAINKTICLLNKENGIDKTEEIYNPLNVSNKGKKQLDIKQEEYSTTF